MTRANFSAANSFAMPSRSARSSFDELEVLVTLQRREPRVLQRDVVVLVEIVEPDDFVAALEQQLRRMEADESGRARDEYFQASFLRTIRAGRSKLPSAARA